MVKNVLDFEEFIKEASLNEGLLITYPIDKVVKYIQNKFNLTNDDVDILIDDGEYILVSKKLDDDLFEKIEEVLRLGGYYQADREGYENPNFFTYEKKFEDETSNKSLYVIRYLYHVSPSINDKKIQSMGLIPKSKNYKFNYPDRIYFFSDKDVKEKPDFIEQMCRELYRPIYLHTMNQLLKKSIDRETVARKRINEYSVYRIDFEKLEGIKLYRDPNTRNFDSYYTTDNIRPEWIEKIDEIKL